MTATTGKQPCSNYFSRDVFNAHECYRCGGTVYWCDNCTRDHHEGGYETCKVEARCVKEPFYRDKPKETAADARDK